MSSKHEQLKLRNADFSFSKGRWNLDCHTPGTFSFWVGVKRWQSICCRSGGTCNFGGEVDASSAVFLMKFAPLFFWNLPLAPQNISLTLDIQIPHCEGVLGIFLRVQLHIQQVFGCLRHGKILFFPHRFNGWKGLAPTFVGYVQVTNCLNHLRPAAKASKQSAGSTNAQATHSCPSCQNAPGSRGKPAVNVGCGFWWWPTKGERPEKNGTNGCWFFFVGGGGNEIPPSLCGDCPGLQLNNHYKDPGSLLNNQDFMESKKFFVFPCLRSMWKPWHEVTTCCPFDFVQKASPKPKKVCT